MSQKIQILAADLVWHYSLSISIPYPCSKLLESTASSSLNRITLTAVFFQILRERQILTCFKTAINSLELNNISPKQLRPDNFFLANRNALIIVM